MYPMGMSWKQPELTGFNRNLRSFKLLMHFTGNGNLCLEKDAEKVSIYKTKCVFMDRISYLSVTILYETSTPLIQVFKT